jgi:hypothetical protein
MKSILRNTAKVVIGGTLVLAAFVFMYQVAGVVKEASACTNCGCPTTNCPQPTPAPAGTCYPNKNTVNVGEAVTWTAVASGGNGSFTYSWAGDEGKSGTGSVLTTSYSTPGTKNIIASITSGNYTIRRQCYVNVVNNTPDLSVYCVANPGTANINENVTYSATVSGGTGNYSYSWSGTP